MDKEIVVPSFLWLLLKRRDPFYTPEPFLFFHLINAIVNLYSSHFLALPMNYSVIRLSQRDPLIQ